MLEKLRSFGRLQKSSTSTGHFWQSFQHFTTRKFAGINAAGIGRHAKWLYVLYKTSLMKILYSNSTVALIETIIKSCE